MNLYDTESEAASSSWSSVKHWSSSAPASGSKPRPLGLTEAQHLAPEVETPTRRHVSMLRRRHAEQQPQLVFPPSVVVCLSGTIFSGGRIRRCCCKSYWAADSFPGEKPFTETLDTFIYRCVWFSRQVWVRPVLTTCSSAVVYSIKLYKN